MIPAYLVGYPDAPGSLAEADLYFDAGPGALLFSNGVLPLLHVFFFLWFLGVLRGSEGESGALSSVIVFAALSAVGFAAEIVYPATLLCFEGYDQDDGLGYASLALASWPYHYCQVGASVMIGATSLAALTTGILPRWLALAGLVVAVLTLLHFLLPLLGALAGLLWIATVSALMLAGGVGSGRATRTRAMRRPRLPSRGGSAGQRPQGIGGRCLLPPRSLRYRGGLIADHPPPSGAPHPHRDVARRVIETFAGARSPRPPSPDDDGGIPVDADAVLVAAGPVPVASAGPERGQVLLPGHDPPPSPPGPSARSALAEGRLLAHFGDEHRDAAGGEVRDVVGGGLALRGGHALP